ncbi:MAG: DUF1801 domain-containing protein [Rhizomicrobium sp.]
MIKAAKKAKKPATKTNEGGSAAVDAKIKSVSGWRGDMLGKLRKIIREAAPGITEDVKWRKASNPLGVPVFEHDGIICTGETYKSAVKLTFAYGASLDDPSRLFNASLEGGTRRAIDFHEGAKIDEKALKALVRAAAAFNTAKAKK